VSQSHRTKRKRKPTSDHRTDNRHDQRSSRRAREKGKRNKLAKKRSQRGILKDPGDNGVQKRSKKEYKPDKDPFLKKERIKADLRFFVRGLEEREEIARRSRGH